MRAVWLRIERTLRGLPKWQLAVLAIFFGVIFLTVFGPCLAPFPTETAEPARRLLPPGGPHPFGTDENGIDILSRVLAAPRQEGELAPGAPVVLRLDMAAFDRAPEAVWERGLNSAARGHVRRARKAGLAAAEETGPGAIQAFYAMLRLAYVRHGAPLPPVTLFEALVTELGGRILVVRNRANGGVRAGLLWLRDGPIAWVPYSGAYHSADSPGNLLFWAVVEQAAHDGADILDFGRSPIGSGTDRFKRNFGAKPIPVLWLSDKSVDLYRRYRAAQNLWRALPDSITDRAGPRLCRYLADY